MNGLTRRLAERFAAALTAVVCVLLLPAEAAAYLGPGGAITGIGALLALVAALLAALFGFLWYPAKRFVRWLQERRR